MAPLTKVVTKSTFLLLFIIAFTGYSQNLNTYQLANNTGVYGLGYNPASIADSRYAYHLNLGAMAGIFGQNLVDNSYLPFSNKSFSFAKSVFKTERVELFGPSLMVQLPKGNAFAIATKYRAGQGTDSPDIGNLFENKGLAFNNSNAHYSSVSAREIAFSYAHPFAFKSHFFKAGATVKLAAMSHFTEINFKNGSLKSTSTGSSSLADNYTGDIYYNSAKAFDEFSITNVLKNKNSGVGFDLGFIYEFRPKHEDYAYKMDGREEYESQKSKYLIKIGISIMDIGQFDGSKIETVYNLSNLTAYKIDDKSVGGPIINDISKLPPNDKVVVDGSNLVKLPKRLNIFIDTKLGKKGWFLGAFMNFKSEQDILQHKQNLISPTSILALIPRFEKDGFNFSMPIIYQKNSKKYGLGMQLNMGSIFVGTEAINSFFQKNGPNPTIYAGFSISKLAKKIRDSDGDGVSDKKDQCPEVKGLWLFKGCPDSDGDGIKDSDDNCPQHAGPKETKGCPDTDADGIFDKNDACPTLPGPAKFNGCPDTDNDGIVDSEDECPTKAGLEEFGGCPDTDKDGLMDNEDECPDLAGLKLLKGCPDTDGDGIADKNDACPNVKGTLANKGCPDQDNDGIVDQDDDCPIAAGTKQNKGCPDTDNDGLIDKNDACPTIKGDLEYDGCPLQNYTKPNEDLAKEQNKILTNFAEEILLSKISTGTIEQLKNTVLAAPSSKLLIISKGAKSAMFKSKLAAMLVEKLQNMQFEILEENLQNLKTGVEIRLQF